MHFVIQSLRHDNQYVEYSWHAEDMHTASLRFHDDYPEHLVLGVAFVPEDEDCCCVAHRLCVEPGGTSCASKHSEGQYIYSCTRAAGHPGKHIACGLTGHNYTSWS